MQVPSQKYLEGHGLHPSSPPTHPLITVLIEPFQLGAYDTTYIAVGETAKQSSLFQSVFYKGENPPFTMDNPALSFWVVFGEGYLECMHKDALHFPKAKQYIITP